MNLRLPPRLRRLDLNSQTAPLIPEWIVLLFLWAVPILALVAGLLAGWHFFFGYLAVTLIFSWAIGFSARRRRRRHRLVRFDRFVRKRRLSRISAEELKLINEIEALTNLLEAQRGRPFSAEERSSIDRRFREEGWRFDRADAAGVFTQLARRYVPVTAEDLARVREFSEESPPSSQGIEPSESVRATVCGSCGEALAPAVQFCGSCGSPVVTQGG